MKLWLAMVLAASLWHRAAGVLTQQQAHIYEAQTQARSFQLRQSSRRGDTPALPGPFCVADPLKSYTGAGMLMVLAMFSVMTVMWVLAGPWPAGQRLMAQPATSPGKPKIKALDGMRTVLVVAIILHNEWIMLPEVLRPAFAISGWAIQFFFVLSGFILCYTSKEVIGRVFVARRLARLLPAYYMSLLVLYIFHGLGPTNDGYIAWPVQAIFAQSLMPVRLCTGSMMFKSPNSVGWFGSTIVVISCFFPMLVRLLLLLRGSLHATLTSLVFVLVLRSTPTLVHHILPQPFEHRILVEFLDLYYFAPIRLLEFFAGMLAAQVCSELSAKVLKWPAWGYVFDLCLVLAGLVIWRLPWPRQEEYDPLIRIRADPKPLHGDFFLTGVWCLLCIAASSAAGVGGIPASGLLGRIFACRPCVALAEYSYAAYILQLPAGMVTAVMTYSASHGELPTAAAVVASMAHPWRLVEKTCRFYPVVLVFVCFTAAVAISPLDGAVRRVVDQRLKRASVPS